MEKLQSHSNLLSFPNKPRGVWEAEAKPLLAVTGTPTLVAFKSCKKNVLCCAVQQADEREVFLLAPKSLSSGPGYGSGSPRTLSWML